MKRLTIILFSIGLTIIPLAIGIRGCTSNMEGHWECSGHMLKKTGPKEFHALCGEETMEEYNGEYGCGGWKFVVSEITYGFKCED